MSDIPIFELRKLSGKRVALVRADNILCIFKDGSKFCLGTLDGENYHFHNLELYMMSEIKEDEPEYKI